MVAVLVKFTALFILAKVSVSVTFSVILYLNEHNIELVFTMFSWFSSNQYCSTIYNQRWQRAGVSMSPTIRDPKFV